MEFCQKFGSFCAFGTTSYLDRLSAFSSERCRFSRILRPYAQLRNVRNFQGLSCRRIGGEGHLGCRRISGEGPAWTRSRRWLKSIFKLSLSFNFNLLLRWLFHFRERSEENHFEELKSSNLSWSCKSRRLPSRNRRLSTSTTSTNTLKVRLKWLRLSKINILEKS